MKKWILYICLIIVSGVFISGCKIKKNENRIEMSSINDEIESNENLSITKYSDKTKRFFEETKDGYKAAVLKIEDIEVSRITEYIVQCDKDTGYYQYIYADPDSWDMFIYYPIGKENYFQEEFKFLIEDGIVKIFLEKSTEESVHSLPYILIRVQAPLRGTLPNASQMYVDNTEIDLVESKAY